MPSETVPILEAALAEWGIALTPVQRQQFADYADLLVEWNATKLNLTRLVSDSGIAIGHFLDSLAVTRATEIGAKARLVDLGTGAGFPGLPIKILRPDLRLTLVEGTAKKLRFCQTVVNQCKITEVELIHGRAEDLCNEPGIRGSFDIATARAVAPMVKLLPWAVPFLKRKGIFVAWKGPAAAEEMQHAADVAARLHQSCRIVPVTLPLSGEPPRTDNFILCQREE